MPIFAFFEQADHCIGFMAGRKFAQSKCEVERFNNHVRWSLPESDRPDPVRSRVVHYVKETMEK